MELSPEIEERVPKVIQLIREEVAVSLGYLHKKPSVDESST